MKKRRTKHLNIRLTDEEYAFIEALAEEAGRGVSTVYRVAAQIGFGVPSQEEANIRSFAELVQQLSRVGNNLNQLTKRANRGQLVMTDDQAQQLAETSEQVNAVRLSLVEFQRLAGTRDVLQRIEELKL